MIPTIRLLKPKPENRAPRDLPNSRAWRAASKAWLQRYPVCVLCLCRGKINERATEDTCTTQRLLVVDHIEPHRGDDRLFWDHNNWQTLCRLCHDVDKQRHEQAGKSGAAWRQMLMDEAKKHGSEALIQTMAEWLPPGWDMGVKP